MMPGQLLTVPELAERWSLSTKTIYNWSTEDAFPYPVKPVKLGFNLRFRLNEVEAAEKADRVILALSGEECMHLQMLLAADAAAPTKRLRMKLEQARDRRITGVL